MGWPVPNLFKGQSPREPASIVRTRKPASLGLKPERRVSVLIYGGEESRTPVQSGIPVRSYMLSFVFKSRSDPAREGRLNSNPAQYI